MERRTKLALAFAGAVVLGVGGTVGWLDWDLRTNYAPVRATVLSVAEDCMLERTSYDQNDNPSTERKGPMGCGEAERLTSEDGGHRGFELQRRRAVTVRYVSPADGRAHVATIRPREGYLEGSVPGAQVEIVAHKREPEKVGLRP